MERDFFVVEAPQVGRPEAGPPDRRTASDRCLQASHAKSKSGMPERCRNPLLRAIRVRVPTHLRLRTARYRLATCRTVGFAVLA